MMSFHFGELNVHPPSLLPLLTFPRILLLSLLKSLLHPSNFHLESTVQQLIARRQISSLVAVVSSPRELTVLSL